MLNKKPWFAPLVAALALSALPAWSALHPRYTTEEAPPAPQDEVAPPHREGYVWAPGYWDYTGHQRMWKEGHWVRERRGYHYEPAHWAQENGRWNLYAENWVHDEDRDRVTSHDEHEREGIRERGR